ncbi:hypothetical protein DsansV1_C09g0095711 [Dioscorea sansibarensis]
MSTVSVSSSALLISHATLPFTSTTSSLVIYQNLCRTLLRAGFQTQWWQLNTRVALVAGLNPTPYGMS